MLQSQAGYIDARPLTANSTKFSCNARPEHPPCGIAMSNEMTRRMLQVAVQRAVAQCAIAERAVIGGGPRGGAHARGWAGSGLIVWTGRASAWLHAAAEVVRRGFAAVIW